VNRRRLLLTAIVGTLVAPAPVRAQQAGKVYHVGFIGITPAAQSTAAARHIEAFRDRLRELGWIEGRNLSVLLRFHEGRLDAVPALMDELIRTPVDVIVTVGDPVTAAVMRTTGTIPIVMASAADPIKIGAAESLARPGKNATGLIMYGDEEVFGKYVQLLKEIQPRTKKFDILWDVDPEYGHLAAMLRTARRFGMDARVHQIQDSVDLHRVLTSLTTDLPEAIFVLSGPVNRTHRERVVAWTLQHRVPAMSDFGPFVAEGLLIAYSLDFPQQYRRVAEFVDKVLKGNKPTSLPIEQPTRFQLVINLKTANAVGITVPQSLLSRADQVIP
jgi:putative ABC transport system substrate-binding protein